MATTELISSDSHVQVGHDAIKAHLATKYHDEYDRAVEGFMLRMMGGAGAANQAWATKRQRREGSRTRSGSRTTPVRATTTAPPGSSTWTSTACRPR